MTVEKGATAAVSYRVGDEVRHAKFGIGEVVAVGDGTVVARFKDGEKTLVAAVAPLNKVVRGGGARVYGLAP